MLTQFRLPSTSLQTILLCLRACSTSATGMGNRGSSVNKAEVPVYTSTPKPKVTFTEDELRQRLSAEEYHITQQKGTERAGSGMAGYTQATLPSLYENVCSVSIMCVCLGPHLKVTEEGEFTCVVCGNQLFETDAKFESGTGWPSFSDVASRSDSVVRVVDNSHGMVSFPPCYIHTPLSHYPGHSNLSQYCPDYGFHARLICRYVQKYYVANVVHI